MERAIFTVFGIIAIGALMATVAYVNITYDQGPMMNIEVEDNQDL